MHMIRQRVNLSEKMVYEHIAWSALTGNSQISGKVRMIRKNI